MQGQVAGRTIAKRGCTIRDVSGRLGADNAMWQLYIPSNIKEHTGIGGETTYHCRKEQELFALLFTVREDRSFEMH